MLGHIDSYVRGFSERCPIAAIKWGFRLITVTLGQRMLFYRLILKCDELFELQ